MRVHSLPWHSFLATYCYLYIYTFSYHSRLLPANSNLPVNCQDNMPMTEGLTIGRAKAPDDLMTEIHHYLNVVRLTKIML